MPSIEFEVYCECGELLDATESMGNITVTPCQKCLDAAHDEGYEERDKEGE